MRNPCTHWAATRGKPMIPRRRWRLIWQPEATPNVAVAACWLHVAEIRSRNATTVPGLSPHAGYGTGEIGRGRRGHHGHRWARVARAILSRYSHVRMEAKRRALDEIVSRHRAADDKRQQDAERQQRTAVVSPPVLVQ